MSATQTVQQVYDAFARGDVPTVLGLMSPQVQWREPVSLPFEDQVGPEAIAQNVFAVLPTLFAEFAVEVDELLDAGEAVVALGTYVGTGLATGARLEADFAHVWRCGDDGKVTFFRTYTDTQQWREVLGDDQAAPVPTQASGGTAAAVTAG